MGSKLHHRELLVRVLFLRIIMNFLYSLALVILLCRLQVLRRFFQRVVLFEINVKEYEWVSVDDTFRRTPLYCPVAADLALVCESKCDMTAKSVVTVDRDKNEFSWLNSISIFPGI